MADKKPTTKRVVRPTDTRRKRPGPRESTTGKVHNVKADQTNWRVKLRQSRIKFDDDQKAIYLKALERTGRKGVAAAAADVCPTTAANHIKNDEEFATLSEQALDRYRDRIAAEVYRRGTEGWEEPVYQKGQRVVEPVLDENGVPRVDANGQPVYRLASVRRFDTSLLILEAKRVDATYREKQSLDVTSTGGGVLLAPAGMTPEDYMAEAEAANREATKKRQGS